MGRTIGSAASGATERANADTAALFAILWAEDSTLFPIQDSAGGATTRGASAAADFAANKRLPLPDLRGRVLAGKDNAGGTPANRLTSATAGVDGTKVGAAGGSQSHTLTSAQMPAHNHGVTDPGHGHAASQDAHSHTSDGLPMARSAAGYGLASPGSGYTERVALYVNSTGGTTVGTSAANANGVYVSGNTTGITTQNNGSGNAHPIVQPTFVGNPIVKL